MAPFRGISSLLILKLWILTIPLGHCAPPKYLDTDIDFVNSLLSGAGGNPSSDSDRTTHPIPQLTFDQVARDGLQHMSTIHPTAELYFAHADKGRSASPSITDFTSYTLHFLYNGHPPENMVSITSNDDVSGWQDPKYDTIPSYLNARQYSIPWNMVQWQLTLEDAAMRVFNAGYTWDIWDVTVFRKATGPPGSPTHIYWGFTLVRGEERIWVRISVEKKIVERTYLP